MENPNTMKTTLPILMLIASGIFAGGNVIQAQTNGPTELSVSLLAKIGIQGTTSGSSDTFSVSFGAFNGTYSGLLDARTTYYNNAVSFLSYFNNNSRSIYTWSGVTGNLVDGESSAYYRNFSKDNTVDNYAGTPPNSIWSSSFDNTVLALITNTTNSELALINLGINWTDPTVPTASGVLTDTVVLTASGGSSAIWGSTHGTYINTTSVPEPSSASLMLLGAVGMMALRCLRKITA
jgi:hypothetical protein